MNRSDLTLFARLENAFDVERRTHTSFLKDVAPLPGRNLSMGARWEFSRGILGRRVVCNSIYE